MKEQRLHTPDGVRDIYNGECQKKLSLQNSLHRVLNQYGYQDIQTPSIEFFNIFSEEIGTTPSKDLYKFFDKEGNTLVLRPDFTPSVARSAAKYYMDEKLPVKLCYMGNTFVNSSDYQLKLKETTQCGAELIGDSSSASDSEILAMAVDCLKASGLTDFRITVGHSMFLSSLLAAADAEEEISQLIYEYLANKNLFGVQEMVERLTLSAELKELFSLLGNYDMTMDQLTQAKRTAREYPDIYKALDELESLYYQLKLYGIDRYVSFELGIVNNLHYYTGLIFSGYTFGTGEAIIKGGRYDKLLSYFGKNAPAIGFAINVDQLMFALFRQKVDIPVEQSGKLIVFSKEHQKKAIESAIALRGQGKRVEILKFDSEISRDDYQKYAADKNMLEVEFFID